jgi:glycosyltransferase involved in cell wall biosynthesis
MRPAIADSASDDVKIMLVTNSIEDSPTGGRALLSKLNYDILLDIFGDKLILCEIPKNKLRGWKSIFLAFNGYIDGLNDSILKHALNTLQTKDISRIFVDGSGFGTFVKSAKSAFPQMIISTFFHNAEAKFFLGALRDAKTMRAFAVLLANYLAERKSVRYSDNIVCLSDRDSESLRKLYGRGATHISPMAMRDTTVDSDHHGTGEPSERYALFVGGGFYANRAGLEWYVEKVVPRINIKTYIVGRGLDDLKQRMECNDKVVLVGAVGSLVDWYRNAQFVVAPIFDGSGMKTKVAEALMFGKRVVGTPEAFSGYENLVAHAGWECRTADEFVAAIGVAHESITDSFDPTLRALYDSKYSFHAARARLAAVLSVGQ